MVVVHTINDNHSNIRVGGIMYMFQQQKNKPKKPEISAIAFTEIEKLYRQAMKLQGIK